MAALGLPGPTSSWFEYRDDDLVGHSYADVSVQWHLHNPEGKPHFAATAAMPAGVLVLDVTSVLEQQQQGGGSHVTCPSVSNLSQVRAAPLADPRLRPPRAPQAGWACAWG